MRGSRRMSPEHPQEKSNFLNLRSEITENMPRTPSGADLNILRTPPPGNFLP